VSSRRFTSWSDALHPASRSRQPRGHPARLVSPASRSRSLAVNSVRKPSSAPPAIGTKDLFGAVIANAVGLCGMRSQLDDLVSQSVVVETQALKHVTH
jgi:hypothetical protein